MTNIPSLSESLSLFVKTKTKLIINTVIKLNNRNLWHLYNILAD